MLANRFTSKSSSTTSKGDLVVPDAVIVDFLGLGLAYSEWPAEVKNRGYVWSPNLEKAIIEKEWEFFRSEIQRLRSEPNISHSLRVKSNSLTSILKRLKGEPWLQGLADERKERLRTHRLLGKDAKIRCLQKYARKWDEEAISSKSSPSAKSVTDAPLGRTIPGDTTLALGPTIDGLTDVWSSSNAFWHEAGPVGGNLRAVANSRPSRFDSPAEPGYLRTPLATQSGAYSVEISNLNSAEDTPFVDYDEVTAPLSHCLSIDDDLPTLAGEKQRFCAPEPQPNSLEWMTKDQGSRDLQLADPSPFRPDTGFQGTFLAPCDSIDMNTFFDFEDNEKCEDESATEGIPMEFTGHPEFPPGLLGSSSHSISSLRAGSNGRKRRRRSTPELSLDRPSCEHDITPTTSNMTADGDTMMSGGAESPQYINTAVSKLPFRPLSPPSKLLSLHSNSGMTPQTIYEIRAQIELESEVQRNELAFVKKQHEARITFLREQHQKEMESSIRKQDAMEAENSRLHQQIRELQKSAKQYEEWTRNAVSEKIVLQESISRRRSVSERPLTSSGERDHGTKQVQFPSSKNPRPLSLTLRPATSRKTSPTPPRQSSSSNLNNASSLQLPISTSSRSRPVTPDNTQLPSGNPVPLEVSPRSSEQSYKPDSSYTNEVLEAQYVPVPSPPKSVGGRVPENIAAPISATSSRKGFLHSMRTLSGPFLRKQYRDDSAKAPPIVPSLPPLEASVPLNRQMAGVLVDGEKRLTNDSGYDSLRSENSHVSSNADL